MATPNSLQKSQVLSAGTGQTTKTSSSSGASSSNTQASGVGSNSANHNALPGAGANLDLIRFIRLPNSYNPKKDGDFKTWVRHLEHYFTLLNIGDDRKTTVLLYYLGAEASDTAFHLNITEATNYEEAKNALMQYFCPVETTEELRTLFHQRYQSEDETLEHFAMELRVLCSKAYTRMNPEELDEIAKQQYILGIRNNIARERLIIQRPTKLKDAMEYARLLEVANTTARYSSQASGEDEHDEKPEDDYVLYGF